jgi:O-antigen/teichoic acid export membrane protein
MPNGNFYEAGAYVVLLIGGTKLVDMIFGPSSEIIVLSKYYWFNIIVVSILAISGLILNYILIPQFGIMGAAIATAISIILFNCIKYLFIFIKLRIQPFNFSFVKIFAICGVCILINLSLPQFQNSYVDILFRSGIITIVFGGLALWLNISEEGGKLFTKGVNFIKGNGLK